MAETNLKGDPQPADSIVEVSNTPAPNAQPRWVHPVRTPNRQGKDDLLKQAKIDLEACDVDELKALLKKYKKSQGLKVTGVREDLIARVTGAVDSGKIKPRALFDHLDQIRENGDQYIFLFKLRDEHVTHLNHLKDLTFIREQLNKYGLEDRLVEPQLIWESSYPYPQLATVTYKPNQRSPNVLKFKWVETRFWGRLVRDGANRRIVPARERSVNFALIDLEDGAAEIRLQKLQPRPRKSLNAELTLYREQLNDLIDFGFFNPLLLESNVRGLLGSRELMIKDWKVRFREGGIGGDLLPNFLQKVGVKILPAVGVYVLGEWQTVEEPDEEPAKGKKKKKAKIVKLTARVDGRKDMVTISDKTSAKALSGFLDELRSRGGLSIEIPELKKIADDHDELNPVLGKLDVRLREGKESAIDLDKFATTEWAAAGKVLQAAHILIEQYPDRFTIKYSLVCPVNEKPALDREGKVIAVNPEAPLQNFACAHDEADADHSSARQHTTRVKTELVAHLPETVSLKTVWSELLRYIIVEKLLGRILERLLSNALLAGFTVIYLIVLLAFGKKIFALIESVAFRQSLIAVTYLLGLVLMTSLVIRLVGWETFERAWRSVKEMFSKTRSDK